MYSKGIFMGLAATFLAGIVISSVYFYFGFYHRLSEERKHLRAELAASRAAESKMQKDMSQLRVTLEETKAELARKNRLAGEHETQMRRFTEWTPPVKPRKKTVVAEADKPEPIVQKPKSVIETPLQMSPQPSGQQMGTAASSETARATATRAVIGRSAIALEVRDREPVQVSEQVSVRQQRVYCWIHVINGEGEKITVRWISKGQKIAQTDLAVGSDSWRTWSYLTIQPSMLGPARAEILDERGELLKSLSFEITEPAASSSTG